MLYSDNIFVIVLSLSQERDDINNLDIILEKTEMNFSFRLGTQKNNITYAEYQGGHGNPLQYSCLENPMNRGAWWVTVHRVANSQT